MRTQEFTGKTTQEAIDAGLAALGVTIADVHVDVLQEGAKGLFGLFGSKPARVRLTVMEEEREDDHGLSDLLSSFSLSEQQPQRKRSAPKPAAPKAVAPAPKPVRAEDTEKPAAQAQSVQQKPAKKQEIKPEQKAEPKPQQAEKAAQPAPAQETAAAAPARKEDRQPREKKPRAPRPPREKAPRPQHGEETGEERAFTPMTPARTFIPTQPPVMHDEGTPAGRAQRFLMDVTERMNVKVDVYVDDAKADNLYIHMIGDTLGILIGRRGETLDALQYLTSLQVNKGRDGYVRVTLDTENYRAKREDSLRRLAQRMANRAQKTGRKVVLEPMNPYERRVLHTALQSHPAVTTHSEGEEPNRRVVIMLKSQPERAPQVERAEEGEKPASPRRGRGRRRGPRKNAAVQAAPAVPGNTQNVQADAVQAAVIAPEKPETVDVLGVEE